MKKKLAIIGVSCGFLVLAGICYSCSYQNDKSSDTFVTSLEEDKPDLHENELSNKQIQNNDPSLQKKKVSGASDNVTGKAKDTEVDAEEKQIYIHICGAVKNPGVYQTEEDSRIFDVILLAGGLIKNADGDYINQAQTVMDGQRIYIPTKQETKELATGGYMDSNNGIGKSNDTKDTEANGGLININQASMEELMELPGIGQAKAESIVKYRETKGSFKSIEEVMEVPGIKEGLFSRISSNITVK